MPSVKGHSSSSSPSIQSRSPSSLVRAILQAQPRAVRPRARIVMTPQPPPPPPRVVLALEDTFRIPVTPSPRRRSETEDVVLIPSLGDRVAEDGVHALLGRHGIGPRFAFNGNTLSTADGDNEMEDTREGDEREGDLNMELDELEPDCLSSQTPSRAGSPAPSSNHPHSILHPRRTRSRNLASSARRRHAADQEELDQDLAGVCFSPTGEWLYVGSLDAVAEWGIRGAEKRWWGTAAWA
jgi:hypothetical protein